MPITGKEHDYEAEGHARTLIEAESIKADPKKFHRAMKHVKKTHKAHKSLIAHAKSMADTPSEED